MGKTYRSLEDNGGTGLQCTGGVDNQLGESLDGEGRVLLGAGLDELRGQGEDLVEAERSIKGLREGNLLLGSPDVRGVASLDGEDGASGGEIGLVHDGGSSAEVGGHTNTLEDGGSGNEALDISDTEVVDTLGDGSNLGALEGGGQEADVGGLVLGNLLDVAVEGGIEAGGGEVGLREALKTIAVELVLEVLKGQGVVQDIAIIDSRSLLDRSGSGEASGGDERNGSLREMHYEGIIRQ